MIRCQQTKKGDYVENLCCSSFGLGTQEVPHNKKCYMNKSKRFVVRSLKKYTYIFKNI